MSTPTPTPEAPVLPPVPWYQSEVQVRAVIALGAQLVSVLLRTVSRFTDVSITTELIDALAADITQGVAILFGILAVKKRAKSEVQPLTLTASSAAAKSDTAQLNPVTLEKRQAGRVQVLMAAALVGLATVASFGITACQSIGVPAPKSYSERLAAGYSAVTSLRTTATTLLNGRVITVADAENVQKQADAAREGLDVARTLQGIDAENKLIATLAILEAARTYLCSKSPTDPNCAGV